MLSPRDIGHLWIWLNDDGDRVQVRTVKEAYLEARFGLPLKMLTQNEMDSFTPESPSTLDLWQAQPIPPSKHP